MFQAAVNGDHSPDGDPTGRPAIFRPGPSPMTPASQGAASLARRLALLFLEPEAIAERLTRTLAVDEAAALRLATGAIRDRQARAASAQPRLSHRTAYRSPGGDSTPLVGRPTSRSHADLTAIAREFVVGEFKREQSTPRLQRVTITLHDEPDAEGVLAALQPWLAAARLGGNQAVRPANATVDGRRLLVETVVATSSHQDEEDADDILVWSLKGDQAAEAWTRSARRLSEAAILALWDLEVPDRERGFPLPSRASAVSVVAQPLGMAAPDAIPPSTYGASTRPAEGGVSVGVTLAEQPDAGATASRLREAQDEIRSEGPPPGMPSYPHVRVEDDRATTISFRVRAGGEVFGASHANLFTALAAALLNVSRACELMGAVVAPHISAVARPIR